MWVKNSLIITLENFRIVWRVLLYILVLVLIIGGISVAFLRVPLKEFAAELSHTDVLSNFKIVVTNLIIGNTSSQEYIEAATNLGVGFEQIKIILTAYSRNITITTIAVIFVGILTSLLINMAQYPMIDMANSYMNSAAKSKFTMSLFKSFGKALVFELSRFIIVFPAFVIFGGIIYLIMKHFSFLGVFSLPAIFLILIGAIALGQTILNFWLPTILIKNLRPFAALKSAVGMVKGNFSRLFSNYIVVDTVGYVLIMVSSFITFGIAPLVLFPAIQLYISNYKNVSTYHKFQLRYYIDGMNVIDPSKIYEIE